MGMSHGLSTPAATQAFNPSKQPTIIPPLTTPIVAATSVLHQKGLISAFCFCARATDSEVAPAALKAITPFRANASA